MAAISLQRAHEMFDMVNARLCCPASAAMPCIPFHYPDDGCWGRAHEMCRLMVAAGEEPRKVWIRGSLRVATHNHPLCAVGWGWHVAPTLEVATGTGSETHVVDPALFDGPVPRATWFAAQSDPNAVLTPTGPEIFHLFYEPHRFDPTYALTNTVLDDYRLELRLRAAAGDGPPPYLACMTPGGGVQWMAMIGPNATERWFTFGWPANWHILWTVMPLTPCPGGPQLTWNVSVERASATESTYWITVRNLTGDPIKFEGRFDVLSS